MKRDEKDVITPQSVLVYQDNNIISFFDEIDSASACEFYKCFDNIERNNKYKKIIILLNSVGGDVYSGMSMYDRIRASKKPVTILGTGFVASMGFIVYLAGDKRVCTKNVRFLNHQASMAVSGRVTDIKIEQKEIELMEDICVDIISERTLLTPKKLKDDTKVGNVYIGAEEALTMGISHEIIPEAKKENIR